MARISSTLVRSSLPLFLTLFLAAAHAGVYRWVDEAGRVHFGDRPPKERPAKSLEMKTAPARPSAAPTAEQRREKQQRLLRAWGEERRQKREAEEKAKKEKQERERKCVVARDRLRNYKNAAYLYDLDKEGNRRIVSEAEKERTIRDLETAIKRHCR
ncbi:MAG: hypothetical protein Kow006_15330 [Gammaproteobacteria bacterium]